MYYLTFQAWTEKTVCMHLQPFHSNNKLHDCSLYQMISTGNGRIQSVKNSVDLFSSVITWHRLDVCTTIFNQSHACD